MARPALGHDVATVNREASAALATAVDRLWALYEHLGGPNAEMTKSCYLEVVRPACQLDPSGAYDAALPESQRKRLAAFYAARAAVLLANRDWEPDESLRDVFAAWDRAVKLDGDMPRYRLERGLARLDFDRLNALPGYEVEFTQADLDDVKPVVAVESNLNDATLRSLVDYLNARVAFQRWKKETDAASRAEGYFEVGETLKNVVGNLPANYKPAALALSGDAFLQSANYYSDSHRPHTSEVKAEIIRRLDLAIEQGNACLEYAARPTPQHAFTLLGNALEDYPWLLKEQLEKYETALTQFDEALRLAHIDGRPYQVDFAHYNRARCRAKQAHAAWILGLLFDGTSGQKLGNSEFDTVAAADAALAELASVVLSDQLSIGQRREGFFWQQLVIYFHDSLSESKLATARYQAIKAAADRWDPVLKQFPDLAGVRRSMQCSLSATAFDDARLPDPTTPEAIELEQQAVDLATALLAESWGAANEPWERRLDLVWVQAEHAAQRKKDVSAAIAIWQAELDAAGKMGGARLGTTLGYCAEWIHTRKPSTDARIGAQIDALAKRVRDTAPQAAAATGAESGQAWATLASALMQMRQRNDASNKGTIQALFDKAAILAKASSDGGEAHDVSQVYFAEWVFGRRDLPVPPSADERQKMQSGLIAMVRSLNPPRVRHAQILANVEKTIRAIY